MSSGVATNLRKGKNFINIKEGVILKISHYFRLVNNNLTTENDGYWRLEIWKISCLGYDQRLWEPS